MKEEESKANIKEKKIPITGKYFNKIKGCRRVKKWLLYHDDNHEADKKSKGQQKPTKKFKEEQNTEKEPKHKQGANLKQVILELLKILCIENDI